MATIKKAQNGAKTKTKTKTPKEKNIFGGSYVSPYSAKRTAKNIANKIGKGIQAIGDPVVSAGHRLGNNLEGAVDVLTGQYWDKRKKKMKNGGSLSGLKASNKRVGPVDPKGAYTKVQKKTLAGAKGKASLTKDKQLGATKMAKRGMSIKKK
jgi:hypothetical protein